jgi:hypothetical protein
LLHQWRRDGGVDLGCTVSGAEGAHELDHRLVVDGEGARVHALFKQRRRRRTTSVIKLQQAADIYVLKPQIPHLWYTHIAGAVVGPIMRSVRAGVLSVVCTQLDRICLRGLFTEREREIKP